MSLTNIRAALETRLNGMTPALSTAWQNAAYTPVTGTPYQRVALIPAEADGRILGCQRRYEQGIFQVTLYYPINGGAALADARAQAIRDRFARGTVMTSAGQSVMSFRHPRISVLGVVDQAWFAVAVSVSYRAEVFS